MTFPMYGKIENIPNHQPEIHSSWCPVMQGQRWPCGLTPGNHPPQTLQPWLAVTLPVSPALVHVVFLSQVIFKLDLEPVSIDWFQGKMTGKSYDLHGKIYGFRLRFSLSRQPIDCCITKIWIQAIGVQVRWYWCLMMSVDTDGKSWKITDVFMMCCGKSLNITKRVSDVLLKLPTLLQV